MSLIVKQSIESEIHHVNDLLSQAPEKDVLGRLSLEGRLESLQEELSELQGEWKKAAEVIVYFGGEPVCGSHSIGLGFAADALKRFQEFVSAIYASTAGTLADMGPMPCLKESQLALAGMPRGSFGFLLQEQVDREPLVESRLQEAIQQATSLLGDMVPDSLNEEIELQAMNSRVFSSLKDFIDCLSKNSASVSIETYTNSVSIRKEEIKSSDIFIKNISEVKSYEKEISGTFKGAVGVKRRFDFIPDDIAKYGASISGRIAKNVDDIFITTMNTEFMDKHCKAFIKQTVTTKNDTARPSVRWELIDININ